VRSGASSHGPGATITVLFDSDGQSSFPGLPARAVGLISVSITTTGPSGDEPEGRKAASDLSQR
jgi:hypothetical protein